MLVISLQAPCMSASYLTCSQPQFFICKVDLYCLLAASCTLQAETRLVCLKIPSHCRAENCSGARKFTCLFREKQRSGDCYVFQQVVQSRGLPYPTQLCSVRKSVLPCSSLAVSGEAVNLSTGQIHP